MFHHRVDWVFAHPTFESV